MTWKKSKGLIVKKTQALHVTMPELLMQKKKKNWVGLLSFSIVVVKGKERRAKLHDTN